MTKKKIIILIVVAAILVAAVVPTAILVPRYIDEHRLDMAIMSDIHVLSEEQMGSEITPSLAAQEAKGQKMLVLSEGLLKEGIDLVIKNKQEVLLIAGDLTDDGGRKSHEAVARELKRAEEKGVSCFVINGNHDINNAAKDYSSAEPVAAENVNKAQFADIYGDYGYDEALSRHSDSLSYTAKLNDEYMLLAIDCSFYEINRADGYVEGRHDSVTTDSLLAWIRSSLETAKNEGYRVIAMMHFPLALHLTDLADNNSSAADRKDEIRDILLEYSVKYLFTGHLHSQDIAAVQSEDGNKSLYDIETAALSNYPMPVRLFKGTSKKEVLTTEYLTFIKEEYVPDVVSAEVKAEILRDLTAYAEKTVDTGMKNKIMNKLDRKAVLSLLGAFGLDKEAPETAAFAEEIRSDLIVDFFDTPIYSDGSGKSVQEICGSFGVSLPASDYDTVWSVAMKLLRANYRGNECCKATDTEGVLLRYSLYTAFYKISDFDLFGRIHAMNADIPSVDLTSSMERLFKEGRLDVEDNNLLGIIGSIKVVARFQERWSKKAVIGSFIESVDFSDARSILDTVQGIWNLSLTLGLQPSSLFEGESVGEILDDLPITQIIEFEEGDLNVGFVYEMLFGDLGTNLITDRAPADDGFEIDKK